MLDYDLMKEKSLPDFIRTLFLMRWLWLIFAGFYLLAYTFWVPNLFHDLVVVVLLSVITLIVAGGLFLEGFWRAFEIERNIKMPSLPLRRLWQLLGGIFLIGYLLVYIPPEGRVVAHWPLDLAITIVAGIMMFVFTVKSPNEFIDKE